MNKKQLGELFKNNSGMCKDMPAIDFFHFRKVIAEFIPLYEASKWHTPKKIPEARITDENITLSKNVLVEYNTKNKSYGIGHYRYYKAYKDITGWRSETLDEIDIKRWQELPDGL